MRKLRLLLAPVLACVLLGASIAPAAVGASSLPAPLVILDSAQKIHPLLQAEAQANPTQVVRVIVQQVRAPAAPSLLGGVLGGLLGSTASKTDEQFTFMPVLVTNVQLSSLAAMAQDPNVRYISPDGPVAIIPGLPLVGGLLNGVLGIVGGLLGIGPGQPSVSGTFSGSRSGVDASRLSTTYPFDTGATSAWAGRAGPPDTGTRVTVAVLDSGVDLAHPDLKGRVIGVNVNRTASGPGDGYGHGTHVAGIIAGQDPAGQYVGIAPGANVVSVKLSDDSGVTYESDVLRGLQWVSQNRTAYNIRAINLSLSASIPQSYATSPIDAAVEYLWSQGVTVVASSGNLGAGEDAVWYAPGNDPRVITVGCLDDNQTVAPGDDSLCLISSRGVTEDGFAKPDVVAPGRKIVSALTAGVNGQPAVLATTFPTRITSDGRHIRLSGTSMSAPMVAGAVALLLQRYPGLTPDQVKKLLVSTAVGYPGQPDKAREINIVAALQAPVPSATPQTLLPVGGSAAPAGAITLLWDGSRWANFYWTGGHWDAGYWDAGHWDATYWDAGHWDSSANWVAGYWDAGHWDAAHWDAGHWDAGHWDAGHWDSSTYD
jgi:serine protease AprX